MSTDDIHYLSIAETANRIWNDALSPVDVVQAYLDRIDQYDASYNAYQTVFREEALNAARQAEQDIRSGHYRGPLHGIPIGVKDLVYTKGGRTTAGSLVMADFVPDFDATIIEKLQAAGAIILGKTSVHEFAYGPTGVNPHYGTPRNPWGQDRLPGGSSSGSGVALAAGLTAGAIGSDTGGSIRIPAALCGIVGIKATYGRVSRYGVVGLSWTLDHLGPMTRTVEDAGLMLNGLAGHDPKDPASADLPVPDFTAGLRDGVSGLRVGVLRDYFFRSLDPDVQLAVEEAVRVLERQGAQIRDVTFPLASQIAVINSPIIQSEAATYHLPKLRNNWEQLSTKLRARLLPGLAVTADIYLNAQRARALVVQQCLELMQDVDVLLAPTEPVGAPRIDDEFVTIQGRTEGVVNTLTRLTRPFNLTGFPAISVPCGFTAEGLPVGLQLASRPWEEATLLRAAFAYEQATEWHTKRPALS